jgi:hypothetical protein
MVFKSETNGFRAMTDTRAWEQCAIDLLQMPDGLPFTDYVRSVDLDPTKSFRFSDLSGISFANYNLSGYDFTGARLWGCHVDGTTSISGARFLHAELDQIIDRKDDDTSQAGSITRTAPMHGYADLRAASDWRKYLQQRIDETRKISNSPKTIMSKIHHFKEKHEQILISLGAPSTLGTVFSDLEWLPELIISHIIGPTSDFLPGERIAVARRPLTVGDFRIFELWPIVAEEKVIIDDTELLGLDKNRLEQYINWLSLITGHQYSMLNFARRNYYAPKK